MKGKVSVGFLKAVAVVSALVIGGGYVAWRQNEADKANKRELVEEANAEVAKEEEELKLMVGSKNPGGPVIGREMTREEIDDLVESYKGYIHTIPVIPEGAEDVTNVVPLLPGSKSIAMPLFTKRQIKEQMEIDDGAPEEEATPPDTNEKLPKLLPGSKSSFVIPPP